MCGFVGIFDHRNESEIDIAILERMNASLVHRGPDDGTLYSVPGLGLAHRRLSVIDVSGGRQPMFNEDRSIATVYNGEIYNFQALASELAQAGHYFRSASDTEVIVHAWEEWGEDCVTHFRGMFAFALWDSRRKILFLARDRVGIKPLYYTFLSDNIIAFASELKALLIHPAFERVLEPTAVEDYFAYGYVPDPKTIYRRAYKLAPGHHLTIQRNNPVPQPKQYWKVLFEPSYRGSEREACEELRERLERAVLGHLISDVPLGGFLSGGLDSSTIVTMMARQTQDRVRTFTVGFPNSSYDETGFAKRIADQLDTDHISRQVVSNELNAIDRLAHVYDEPFADSSAMPSVLLCSEARRYVTVALSGDGGDETFAGYRRYRWHQVEDAIRRRVPSLIRQHLFGLLGSVYPKLDWAPRFVRAKSFLEELGCDSVEAYYRSVSITTDELRKRLYSTSLQRALNGYSALSVLREHVKETRFESKLDQAQYLDIVSYLPGDILTKIDRASMASSLEVRVPLLDHEIVEWAARLPEEFRLKHGTGKYILKKTMEENIPHDLLYRPKMGFVPPVSQWLRSSSNAQMAYDLLRRTLAETGCFEMPVISQLVEEHRSGRSDFGAILWALLMFGSFLRHVHWR